MKFFKFDILYVRNYTLSIIKFTSSFYIWPKTFKNIHLQEAFSDKERIVYKATNFKQAEKTNNLYSE